MTIGAEGVNETEIAKPTQSAFGGGGKGWNGYKGNVASSGGGATDIRILSNDVKNRVLVAAGGGGSGYYINKKQGGNGGAENGEDGNQTKDCRNNTPGEGASQRNGGSTTTSGENGGLGYGGYKTSVDGCGGGGGFYGGGAGSGCLTGGGGGSSFAFSTQSSDLNNKIELPSKYHLLNPHLYSGSTKYGNRGNGYIYITFLSTYHQCTFRTYSFSLVIHSIFISLS